MNAPAKPWSEMSATEKEAAVLPLARAGESYRTIAGLLSAPNRMCVAGVVNRIRAKGHLPPAPSRAITGAAGGALVRAKARKRREATKQPKPAKPIDLDMPARLRSTAKIIALPTASRGTDAALIDAFIAANGVRRFESGASNDLDALRGYAARHGYEIDFTQRGRDPYTIRGGRGRPRSVDRAGLIEFIDQLRISDGNEPFLPRKDDAHGARY